jgi:hypothetical protein
LPDLTAGKPPPWHTPASFAKPIRPLPAPLLHSAFVVFSFERRSLYPTQPKKYQFRALRRPHSNPQESFYPQISNRLQGMHSFDRVECNPGLVFPLRHREICPATS